MGLQGERLRTAEIREAGVVGDHRYVFRNTELDRVIDPVTYAHHWGETLAFSSMLDLRARFATRGKSPGLNIVTPDGRSLSSGDPNFQTQIKEVLGLPVELHEFPQVAESRLRSGRALHLITTSSLSKMKELYPEGDFDPRRFRPNMIASTRSENGFAEEGWVGKPIRIGPQVIVKVEKPNKRCKVTTMKQNDLRQDEKILETISQKNGNVLGVMCSVVRGGFISVGDELEMAPTSDFVA